MKAVRFTKAEVELMRGALDWLAQGQDRASKTAQTIVKKLDAAEAAPAGVNPAPIEQALMAAARGKVVPLAGGWPRVSKLAQVNGATPEDATAIGEWMARQGWLRGPQTLLDVLNKWPQWLAKAKATAPPPSAPSGFGDGAGEKDAQSQGSTAQPGGGAPGRLRPGFGR